MLIEVLFKLSLAAAAGMAIGLEREWREKAAGFRTLALVGLGSAAFMLAAGLLPSEGGARVAAGVVTGVGFLGAGAILRDRGEVTGLTTAAAVWMVAALGVAAAVGAYVVVTAGLTLSLVVLLFLPVVDLTRVSRDLRVYEARFKGERLDVDDIAGPLASAGLVVTLSSVTYTEDETIVTWRATGRPERHRQAIGALRDEKAVVKLTVT